MDLKIKIPIVIISTGYTPSAPKVTHEILEEIDCVAGCGKTCDPDEYVIGCCSRKCMLFVMNGD